MHSERLPIGMRGQSGISLHGAIDQTSFAIFKHAPYLLSVAQIEYRFLPTIFDSKTLRPLQGKYSPL